MAGIDEKDRRRIATILLLLSGILIITGLSTIMVRRGEVEPEPRPVASRPIGGLESDKLALAQAIQRVLLALIVLVIIFAFAGLAWMRWSRRFRIWLLREPRPPTPVDDVWAMHRPPEELEESEDADADGDDAT